MTQIVSRRPAPVATRGIVDAEVRRSRRRSPGGGMLLLRAAADWRGEHTFQVDDVSVTVAPCDSLLAVLDAMTFQATDYLVVLTPFEQHELGETILARAVDNELRAINRWDLVRQAFGAKRLDSRLTRREMSWLPDALLDAQPPGGWAKLNGPLLDHDTALAQLSCVRLGLSDGTSPAQPPDAASLLDWSNDAAAVARFVTLSEAEQQGIAEWLTRAGGPVADVLFRLVRAGHAEDAIAVGLIAGAVFTTSRKTAAIAARTRAESLFGGPLPPDESINAFREACESLLLRWLDGAPYRADAALDSAQRLIVGLQAHDLAQASRVLDAGYAARLRSFQDTVADALPQPRAGDVAAVDEKLTALLEHHLHDVRADTARAVMAARLVRWLAVHPTGSATTGPAAGGAPATVAAHADRQVRDGAWADRALAAVRAKQGTVAGNQPYDRLVLAVRVRRDALDRDFALRLAGWSAQSAQTEELLLAENVLERIARPVAAQTAPLIVVVDGMSAAIACEIAEEVTGRWIEVGRHAEGREGALATLPSITNLSRASLLSGELASGGQAEEQRGFQGFWTGRGTALFHKADVRDGITEDVTAAVADRGKVVAVVLNAVDDSLDKGPGGDGPGWRLSDIAGLTDLLDAAWRAGRPVILTSDHGHVLDRGDATSTVKAEAARYRSGSPGEGEVLVTGPRVLVAGGQVVVPWNERIRYTARKEGYHGGASLAEMVIPVLVFVPSARLIPEGWESYVAAMHEPEWWNAATLAATAAASRTGRNGRRKKAEERLTPDATLFDVMAEGGDGPATAETAASGTRPARPSDETSLGGRTVRSRLYEGQRQFVRVRIDDAQVAALIDALAEAGGKLPITTAAKRAGQLPARMHGYVSSVANLLNIDGYQVLGIIDAGRTVALDLALLREQFLGGGT